MYRSGGSLRYQEAMKRTLCLLGCVTVWMGCGDTVSDRDASAADSQTTDSRVETDEGGDSGVFDSSQDTEQDSTGQDSTTETVTPGLLAIEDFRFVGAFRIPDDDFGPSSANYASGALGYNPDRGSLFLAGFRPDGMVAEFGIPETLSTGDVVDELPVASSLQDFHPILNVSGNPDEMDTVTGMLWVDGDLIVNANQWYDAAGTSTDTTLVVPGGDLSMGQGFFKLAGEAHAAGYMSPIPAAWQAGFGGDTLTGWASNYSIISRYSVGPSLFVFDPAAVLDAEVGEVIPTSVKMNFAYGAGNYLADDALIYDAAASDLWNFLSKAMYAFIVPGTRTFAVFGHNGGVDSGTGYKIVQTDGNVCGGPCAYDPSDYYNYYWFFDVDEILAASDVSEPRPYAYGRWSVPFGEAGEHAIIGGAWAPDRGQLFLALDAAGQTGTYDRPPAVIVMEVDTGPREESTP